MATSATMLCGAVPAMFQHIQEACKASFEIGVRVFRQVPDAGLGGQMYHWAEGARTQELFRSRPISEIEVVGRQTFELT